MDSMQALVLSDLRKTLGDPSDQELLNLMSAWALVPHMDGGEMTGVKILKGSEFHFLAADKFKLNRKVLRESLAPHLEQHGFLTTRVQHADKANQRFNKLFGFQPTWADDTFQYFILTELPFKDKKCQQ